MDILASRFALTCKANTMHRHVSPFSYASLCPKSLVDSLQRHRSMAGLSVPRGALSQAAVSSLPHLRQSLVVLAQLAAADHDEVPVLVLNLGVKTPRAGGLGPSWPRNQVIVNHNTRRNFFIICPLSHGVIMQ